MIKNKPIQSSKIINKFMISKNHYTNIYNTLLQLLYDFEHKHIQYKSVPKKLKKTLTCNEYKLFHIENLKSLIKDCNSSTILIKGFEYGKTKVSSKTKQSKKAI